MDGRPTFEGGAAGSVAVYRLDGDLTVTAANAACARWLGRPVDEIVGRRVADLAPGPAVTAVTAMLRALVDDPTVDAIHGERVFAPATGASRRIRFVVHREPLDGGLGTEYVVTAIDLDGPGCIEVSPALTSESAAAGRLADRHGLGPRHREMLTLLATGHRVPQIADELFLARGTVRNRIVALGDALGVRGQAEIVQLVRSEVRGDGATRAPGQPGNVSPR